MEYRPGLLELPIKSCHRCWASYTIAEFAQLDDAQGPPELDYRWCNCGALLAVDPEGLDQLDLWSPIDDYEQHFPNSGRPDQARALAAIMNQQPVRAVEEMQLGRFLIAMVLALLALVLILQLT
jgi:hypothetical protein